MKAVLGYVNCCGDKNKIFRILANNGIKVIKTQDFIESLEHRVTIETENYSELNEIVEELNENCVYGVSVIRTYDWTVWSGSISKRLLKNLFK